MSDAVTYMKLFCYFRVVRLSSVSVGRSGVGGTEVAITTGYICVRDRI